MSNQSSKSMYVLAQPYLLTPSDPAYRKPRINHNNHIKYLTIINQRRIIERVKKLIRKDNKMAKDKYKLNPIQLVCLALLTVAAVEGITELLGGGLRDLAAAAMLSFLLLMQIIENRI